jgi:hypothetical protein
MNGSTARFNVAVGTMYNGDSVDNPVVRCRLISDRFLRIAARAILSS